MGRDKEPESRTPEAVAEAPARPPAQPQPVSGVQQILALQRSAGNHATASAFGAPGPVVARNPMNWFKKKLGGKPKVSGPTDVRPMTEEEKGGVLSMKELIERYEGTLKKSGATGPGVTDEGAEGVGAMVGEAEKEASALEKFRETLAKAGGGSGPGISDEAAEGVGAMIGAGEKEAEEESALDDVGGFFEAVEAEVEAQLERDRQIDESLYQQCKSLGAAMDAPSFAAGGMYAKIALILLKSAVKAWNAAPRRQMNTPEDKARRAELEALIADKMWIADAAEAGGAALEPNPALKSSDQTGYHVTTAVPLQEVKADGTLDAAVVHLTKDSTLTTLTPRAIGGTDGYTLAIGPKTYWMPKDQVVVKSGKFDKVSGPLFPPDPEPAHVKQTTLGDCYLQAAVASMAAKNPALVKAMMRDNGDESVTVRLWKVDDSDEKNHTYSAKYVRVEKSVPKNFADQEIYNAGALWVRLIEKAYAAGGFMGDSSKTAKPTKNYEDIAAGQSRYAMEVLLGQEMKTQFLTGNDLQASGNYASHTESTGTKGDLVWTGRSAAVVPWDANEVTAHGLAKTADNYDNLLSMKILGDKGKVDDWITFVKTDAIKNVFVQRQADRAKGFAGEVTLTDLDTAMSTGLAAGIKDTVMAWLEKQQLFPGTLGSAKYSKFQLDVFAKIQKTLDGGGAVTGGTYKYPGGTVAAGTGASGGEVKDKGMVGGHAFSIIQARALSTANPDDPKYGDFYFVKIRNPWGAYGRKYDMSKGKDAAEAVEGGDGESWLELSDLTKYFETISYG